MSVPQYENRGPLTISQHLNLESLKGKSVIITGGGDGLGKAYAIAFASAGAYVTVADFNEVQGAEVAGQLSPNAQFVKCDVRKWEDQVQVFEEAIKNSPHKSCDVVIANAGVSGPDPVFQLDDPTKPPVKPQLNTLDINLTGVIYTAKLALHYFRRQPLEASRDHCLILKSSIAGYLDLPGSPQYNISKFGVRALMRCLRRTSWQEGIRINIVAPWFIKTKIMNKQVTALVGAHAEFAEVDDAAKAMLRIASDQTVNGRCLGIFPRSLFPDGYTDVDDDDYKDDHFYKDLQEQVLRASHRVKVVNEGS